MQGVKNFGREIPAAVPPIRVKFGIIGTVMHKCISIINFTHLCMTVPNLP